jgi:hypothetical protein
LWPADLAAIDAVHDDGAADTASAIISRSCAIQVMPMKPQTTAASAASAGMTISLCWHTAYLALQK